MTKQRPRPTLLAAPGALGPVQQQPAQQQQPVQPQPVQPLVRQAPQGGLVAPPGPQVSPVPRAERPVLPVPVLQPVSPALPEPQALAGQALPLPPVLQAPAPGSPTA